MGGRGEPQNLDNFAGWATEFLKLARIIWQNFPRKTVGPTDCQHLQALLQRGIRIGQKHLPVISQNWQNLLMTHFSNASYTTCTML